MKAVVYWEYFQRYHNARIRALLTAADAQHHQVIPVSLSRSGFDGHQSERDEIVDSRAVYLEGDGKTTPINDPLIIRQFLALLDQQQPDVVSVVGWYGTGTRKIVRWARRNNKALVLMLAGSQHDKKRNVLKEAYKQYIFMAKIGSVLCGGLSHVRYAQKLGMPADRIFSGYNSVDNTFWQNGAEAARADSDEVAKRLGVRPNNYFITVGRFIEKKNFEGLIETYAKYRQQARSTAWDLIIAGDGPLRASLKSKIDDLQLHETVHLPGYLSTDQLLPYLGLAGTFILASSHFEQWGLVVNEAMAAGLPVIVSDICGCAEDLVIDGKTGFAFPPDKPDLLLEKMLHISSDIEHRNAMAIAAGKHIDGYSPEVFAKNYLTACECALSTKA